MAKLFILIGNGGDGSYFTQYTMNEEWIVQQRERYDNDECDYEYGLGIDCDGFHYDTLTVPDGTTLQQLGITYDCAKD